MKRSLRARSALAVLSIALAACAATPTVQEDRPAGLDLSSYRAIEVVVEAPERVRAMTGYEATSTVLWQEFTDNVRAAGRYAVVGAAAPEGKAFVARLTIVELNYVHGATRGLIGVLGGSAVLHVTMTLEDRATRQVLATIKAGHASSGAQGVFSPTTSRQVTAIAKELSSKL